MTDAPANISVSASVSEACLHASVAELRKQNEQLLIENLALRARLKRWPALAAEHARNARADERNRLAAIGAAQEAKV